MDIEKMNRADLECAILEHDILPANNLEDLATISCMSDAELRAAIGAWIAAGDECADTVRS